MRTKRLPPARRRVAGVEPAPRLPTVTTCPALERRRSIQLRPQPAEPTDEEKAEIERLRTRNDELANIDDEDWTEELVEEADANETRLDEIEATIDARAIYRREDKVLVDNADELIKQLTSPHDHLLQFG